MCTDCRKSIATPRRCPECRMDMPHDIRCLSPETMIKQSTFMCPHDYCEHMFLNIDALHEHTFGDKGHTCSSDDFVLDIVPNSDGSSTVRLNGQGTIDYDGDVFTGQLDGDGGRHGKGTMVYANGDKYEGEWYCHEKNGKGTMVYANGDKYEGDWQSE